MTSTPGHRRGKAVDEAILAAAATLVAETGSTAITIEQVAAAAGVNKTTVYRRWPTIDDLLLAALSGVAATTVPIPDTGDLRGDLLELGRLVRTAISAPIGQALIGAGRRADSDFDELRRRFWETRFAAASTIIEAAVDRGEEAPADPDGVIEALVAPIHFRITERRQTVTDADIEALVDRALG